MRKYAWLLFPFYNIWFYLTDWEGEFRRFGKKLLLFVPFLLLWPITMLLFIVLQIQGEDIYHKMRWMADNTARDPDTRRIFASYAEFWGDPRG